MGNVIASGIAAGACAVFAISYHFSAPWWRSAVGRNLMAFAAAVGALCLYTILITVWPAGCAAVVVRGMRTAVLVAITALMTQRTWTVVRAQSTPAGEVPGTARRSVTASLSKTTPPCAAFGQR
ncbi:hypothetical protein [Streptomyces sp. A1136]|uniref:putative phage holin n=1 Tax=Streptomyces sp. A1136 TaxID=2563102 RepID=UPI0014483633|nr:hypothetical protein [Streptomyces sp. A1136]